ncbi:MAG: hypothetical protein R3D03_07720 [Geminicoccaceae bacterium]
MAMTGRWKVRWGTNGEHSTELDTFDGISVPSGVMRSFENMGDRENVLMATSSAAAILGYCVWSESIAEKLAGG